MRINLPEDQLEYIGTMADKLDISVSELCKRALHMVDTVQLCEDQGIKVVFIEDDEPLDFKRLFPGLFPSLANNTPTEGSLPTEGSAANFASATFMSCPASVPGQTQSNESTGIPADVDFSSPWR